MKKRSIRRVAAVVTFFLLWAGVEACVRYFTEPVEQAWPMIREDRKTIEGTIDTAFIGASLFRNGIIPSVFDQTMGTRSFNYATSSQSMILSNYALEDLSETNALKLALIDISVNRLLSDDSDQVFIAKFVVLSHMLNVRAKLSLVRDCFTLDEIMLNVLHSARDQLHFFWDTLPERLSGNYLKDYVRYGYNPDDSYPAGSMGFMPAGGVVPDGGLAMTDYVSDEPLSGDFDQLSHMLAQCRAKGITPVLISMPTTDAYMLYYDRYEALMAPVKALAEQEGALMLDFNLSKFRVSSLSDHNYTDARHLNASGAELFTPILSEVTKKALAGEDVTGYFYESYKAMIRAIDRVATVKCEFHNLEEGLYLSALSLQDPDVTPSYRFFIKEKDAAEGAYQLLNSDGDRCVLEGVAAGTYRVRVEAYSASDSGYDAYTEKTIVLK